MSTQFEKATIWTFDNILKPGALATALVLLGVGMFTGYIPTTLTTSVAALQGEHKDMVYLLAQICINTAKNPDHMARCFVVREKPGVLREVVK